MWFLSAIPRKSAKKCVNPLFGTLFCVKNGVSRMAETPLFVYFNTFAIWALRLDSKYTRSGYFTCDLLAAVGQLFLSTMPSQTLPIPLRGSAPPGTHSQLTHELSSPHRGIATH